MLLGGVIKLARGGRGRLARGDVSAVGITGMAMGKAVKAHLAVTAQLRVVRSGAQGAAGGSK